MFKLFKKKSKVVEKVNFPKLFQKQKVANVVLKNRFVMAPMTRSRAGQPGDFPTSLMAKYYNQRSSAGLIITEASQVSHQGKGYAWTPGCYTDEQMRGWKKVVNAIHEGGSKVALQLWHVGRVSHRKVNGLTPVAPSAVKAEGTKVIIVGEKGEAKFIQAGKPKELSLKGIESTIQDFVNSAKKAMEAGFDFVEIHGANGYLIDQFLRSRSNKRSDKYGGTPAKRIKFLVEVTTAVVNAIGKDKVGIRLSPFITFKDMADKTILKTILLAAKELEKIGVAFIHLCEADWADAPEVDEQFRINLRETYSGVIIATGAMSPEKGVNLVNKNYIDLVGFGRKFIANPDYPTRVKLGAELNEMRDGMFFGGNEEGYTDYPSLPTKK